MGKWICIICLILLLYDITYCQDQNEEIFLDVFIVDSSVVYVTSQSKYIFSYPSDIINAIYKTTDGGYTWSPHFSDSYQFVGTKLSVVNKNVIFASNWYNDLSKSIDGGDTWSIMYSVITDSVLFISDMQFIDQKNGFILGNGVYNYDGENYQTGPYLLRSSDGGKNWKSKLFTPNTSITDLHFSNTNEGWLISSNGSIYYSNNKFRTYDSTQVSISKFDFQNNISFGISEKNIYKSDDGWNTFNKLLTITSVEVENSVKLEFKLSQNYPNPFNPTTTIQYTIPQSGNVKLELYDLLGRKIKTYINTIVSSGNYDITLNLREYSSGIYIYKLSLENISISKKLILVK